MEKIKISTGMYWVEIPEADLRILCGCPADSVKHLMRRGLNTWREKDGVLYETGPNAILLSDLSIQNGNFANLAEFPCLQMFYRQGMLVPKHPNNTGSKPMLIGLRSQVQAQSKYILRGNYGLLNEQEMIDAGATEENAREMMRLKLRFAFDNIRDTEELVEMRITDKKPVELRNGAFIRRVESNVYEFTYGGESATVDLNLKSGEDYEPAYQLGAHDIRREYFSVIHSGEGDGWDINRPCMASILTFQGKLYLIDAGPNIEHTLRALGISINNIDGVFHTHAHDDHFAGLTTLLRSDRKIKHFATPLVRASIIKKLAALMNIEENTFSRYFEIHDLEFDTWNSIDGLEVKPIFSPHPVETSIMYFRTLWEGGYKTYAHLADTIALDILKSWITEDESKSGVTQEFFDLVKKNYLIATDLKKIDIGGGMIHGNAVDYVDDKSTRALLCHVARPLTSEEMEIGSNATFGMQDVLIPSHADYLLQYARRYLLTYYPHAPAHELNLLLNCPIARFNTGSILVRKDTVPRTVYLVIDGVVNYIQSEAEIINALSGGSLLGEISCIMREPMQGTYRAASYVKALSIPSALFMEFARRNDLYASIMRIHKNRMFLGNTWLFGEMVGYPAQNRIAHAMQRMDVKAGESLPQQDVPELFLIASGAFEILDQLGSPVEKFGPGEFYGEDSILYNQSPMFEARAVEDSHVYRIPGEAVSEIPVVQWKLLEAFERKLLGPMMDF